MPKKVASHRDSCPQPRLGQKSGHPTLGRYLLLHLCLRSRRPERVDPGLAGHPVAAIVHSSKRDIRG